MFKHVDSTATSNSSPEKVLPARSRLNRSKTDKRPAPRVSKGLGALALAWDEQADKFGGISRKILRRIDQIATGRRLIPSTRPGLRLVREWSGKTHVVIVDDDGAIHWNGRRWRSLSEIARVITGTRWSGPVFFGLKRKQPK